jgi:TetR/AcrR family transcriptional regulator, cholesterol catabolism regulator
MENVHTEIIEKVSHLYQKYGIRSVTMDDVARELCISKKTLYQFIVDKEDLVEKVVNHYIDQQKMHFESIKAQRMNAIDVIMEISQHITLFLSNLNPSLTYDLRKYYPSAWKLLMEYKMDHIYNSAINNITRGISEGLYREDLNPEIIAAIYVSRIEYTMEQDLAKKTSFSPSEFFQEVFKYHIRGIASKKGLEYLEKIYRPL